MFYVLSLSNNASHRWPLVLWDLLWRSAPYNKTNIWLVTYYISLPPTLGTVCTGSNGSVGASCRLPSWKAWNRPFIHSQRQHTCASDEEDTVRQGDRKLPESYQSLPLVELFPHLGGVVLRPCLYLLCQLCDPWHLAGVPNAHPYLQYHAASQWHPAINPQAPHSCCLWKLPLLLFGSKISNMHCLLSDLELGFSPNDRQQHNIHVRTQQHRIVVNTPASI